MHGIIGSTTHLSSCGGAETRQVDVHRQALRVRCLAPGEILFQTGDPRGEVYRVIRGSLCHYSRWRRGHHEIIEFVFPGAIVGFGHLAVHASTARAMLRTEIGIVTPDEFECALRSDAQLAARVVAAADREFDYVRSCAMQAAGSRPTQRLASLLAALSRISAREGREATFIPGEILSSAMAERLDMSVDGVAGALEQLEARGIVASSTAGFRIVDIAALERLADANSRPPPSHSKREAPGT